ncbi:MAG: site-specific integrase [Peptococcaceae bacterium]|nr:site-specific integrase [Peptococcaceae bacterium]
MKKTDFPDLLTNFFSQYLTLQRGLSGNSISSYSDAFILFFRYCQEVYGIYPNCITFSKITKELITQFCQWLEEERHSNIKNTKPSAYSNRLIF